MFIKTTKSKNHTYLQLVESYRQDGIVKHKVHFNLGRLDLLQENDQLYRMACKLMSLSGKEFARSESPKTKQSDVVLEEVGRYSYGHIAFKKFWQQLNMDSILDKIQAQCKMKYNFAQVVYSMVINRLLSPSSKLAAFQNQKHLIGLAPIKKLHHLYNCLDHLAKHKPQIERALFHQQRSLFNQSLDVIFYDVTTFHFESVRADELKNFGFSKAGKFNEVQVVLGLLVDQKGRPIGYELFEGNMSEKKTLTSMLQKLAERFSLKRIIIVADKGLNSHENLHAIRQAGYGYIVSRSLKQARKQYQEKVFDQQSYQCRYEEHPKDQLLFKYKSIDHQFTYQQSPEAQKYDYEDQLVISWSSARADKNAKDRQRQVQKAEQYLEKGNLNLNHKKGAKRYIATQGNKAATGIDHQKIKADQKWDGYYAIQYYDEQLTAEQVLEQYHFLWKIEQSFRVLKTTMKTRPIFHWTPKRIKGHFTLCFIAFLIERLLEIKLQEAKVNMSPESIKQALNQMQVSKLNIGTEQVLLKGAYGTDTKQILKALGIPPIKNMQLATEAKF